MCQASIQSALLGRIYDTHVGVLEALYASPDLFLLMIAPTTSPQQLLDIIASQLFPTPPAREVLRAHVAFPVGPFIKPRPDTASAVQQNALFPSLLASKIAANIGGRSVQVQVHPNVVIYVCQQGGSTT